MGGVDFFSTSNQTYDAIETFVSATVRRRPDFGWSELEQPEPREPDRSQYENRAREVAWMVSEWDAPGRAGGVQRRAAPSFG